MRKSRFLSSCIIVTLVANLNAMTFTSAVIGGKLLFTSMVAYASPTPLLDDLVEKHELDKENRNHQTDAFDPRFSPPPSTPRDLTDQINNAIAHGNALPPSQPVDPDKYDLTLGMEDSYWDMASGLSQTHGMPSMVDGSNDIELSYARGATRLMRRDANGNLVVVPVDDIGTVERVQNIPQSHMLSHEVDSDKYDSLAFEADKDELYENETQIFAEGSAIHTNFKDTGTGRNSAARAYRSVTSSANIALDHPLHRSCVGPGASEPCPAGFTESGGVCVGTQSEPATPCPPGTTQSGNNCLSTTSEPPNLGCSSPYVLVGSICQYTQETTPTSEAFCESPAVLQTSPLQCVELQSQIKRCDSFKTTNLGGSIVHYMSLWSQTPDANDVCTYTERYICSNNIFEPDCFFELGDFPQSNAWHWACPTDFSLVAGQCQKITPVNYTPACPDGFTLEADNMCRRVQQTPPNTSCSSGTLVGGMCESTSVVSQVCPSGWTHSAGMCSQTITVPVAATCDNNTADFLQASFATLETTQDPNIWFDSCEDTVIEHEQEISYPIHTDHICQDTSQSNFDFCEVERRIKIPAYADSAGLRSCGLGCYEFDMNIAAEKSKWRCRRTEDNHATPAEFRFRLNMSEPIQIQSVQIIGTAHDHFKYRLNGQTLWENTGLSQSTSGNYMSGSCNLMGSSRHTINTDVTSRVNAITGALPDTGIYEMHFRADLRWRRNGSMDSIIRIQLATTDGSSLGSEFIQYPEGCYDALSEEDKLTRPLLGVYDWEEIGAETGERDTFFNCTRPAAQPTCSIGEQLFGNVTQERCLSMPVCYAPTTGDCHDLGYAPGSFTHTPASCSAGTLTSDGQHCEYDAVDDDGDMTCPDGGALQPGDVCRLDSDQPESCPAGTTLQQLMVEGVETYHCSRTPTTFTSPVWSCSGGHSFSSSHCTIELEDYLDPEGNLYQTVDAMGFSLLPITHIDDEGFPEEVFFEDSASCVILAPPSPEPEPTVPPLSFCTFDDYEPLIEGDNGFPAPIVDMIPQWYLGDTGNKTWRVNLEGYRCDPTNGRIMCFPDPVTGEEDCVTWDDLRSRPNQCQQYIDDTSCSLIAEECTEDWLEEISGRCMATTRTFRCTEEEALTRRTEQRTNTCAGMLPCTGGDCLFGEPESNNDFINAVVMGNVIDEGQSDMTCDIDTGTCEIFKGEYKYCSWEVTGLGTNCCEEPKGADIISYLVFANQMRKVGQMAGSGAFGDGVQGTYTTLAQPISNGYQAVSNWLASPFRSPGDAMTGNAPSAVMDSAGNAITDASTEGMGAVLAQVQQQVYEFVYDMMPETLNNFIFENAAQYATDSSTELVLNETFTNIMSNIMFAYQMYSLAKLALTLLTACDDHEMDMGMRLSQRSCFAVGNRYCSKRPFVACIQRRQDYCCYNSMLSRIIMKESYEQLGINPLPHGTNISDQTERDASCRGLTPEELNNVDFAAPSMQSALEEWIALMIRADLIPENTDEQLLTGGATSGDGVCQNLEQTELICYTDPLTGEEVCEQARNFDGSPITTPTGEECIGVARGGQIWNAHGRQTVSERTMEFIDGAENRVSEGKIAIDQLRHGLDCSITPRPTVCDFGFDPTDN